MQITIAKQRVKLLLNFLVNPNKVIDELNGMPGAIWITPMVLLTGMLVVRLVVAGVLQTRAAALGQTVLPADWQWWTPEMHNNYTQALQVTRGPVFIFIIPIVTSLVKVWLGWFILAGLLHLLSTLMGGRGSMQSTLNLTAWSFLPFFIRDIIRIFYMLISGHVINSPGFSGFVDGLFLAKILTSVDIFFIWFAILSTVGIRALDNLANTRAIACTSVILLFILILQGGAGAISGNLGSMMITRPFF
jgi:hypothetical protein